MPDTTIDIGKTHAVRHCINCGDDAAEAVFTFDRKFMVDVRGMSPDVLEAKAWTDSTTSTIVKCRRCGCHYIRDVFVADEHQFDRPYSPDKAAALLSVRRAQFGRSFVHNVRYMNRIVDMLLRLLLRRTGTRPLSLLDFGSSSATFAMIARARGFETVVAYDIKFAPNVDEVCSTRHPIDVIHARRREQLVRYAPFDAIVCQSADEHFLDLQGELQLMHGLLADHGVLHISHPIMNLDRDIADLRNESNIVDPVRRTALRKQYHIDHLNYVMPRMFAGMLTRHGFRERCVFFFCRSLDAGLLHPVNVLRFGKSVVRYVLDWFGSTHRKTIYFLVKTAREDHTR